MNISWGSPQNFDRGDRWSQNLVSNPKIPLFLQISAPPVANGAEWRSIGNKMLKLTFTYEGLSIGPTKKNPHGSCKNLLIFAGFLRIQFLNTYKSSKVCLTFWYSGMVAQFLKRDHFVIIFVVIVASCDVWFIL